MIHPDKKFLNPNRSLPNSTKAFLRMDYDKPFTVGSTIGLLSSSRALSRYLLLQRKHEKLPVDCPERLLVDSYVHSVTQMLKIARQKVAFKYPKPAYATLVPEFGEFDSDVLLEAHLAQKSKQPNLWEQTETTLTSGAKGDKVFLLTKWMVEVISTYVILKNPSLVEENAPQGNVRRYRIHRPDSAFYHIYETVNYAAINNVRRYRIHQPDSAFHHIYETVNYAAINNAAINNPSSKMSGIQVKNPKRVGVPVYDV